MNEGSLLASALEISVRIVKICLEIQKTRREYDITRQLMRSSTSIAANIQEGNAPESRRDFVHKLSIARKELLESKMWINILSKIGYMNDETAGDLTTELIEVYKILNASIGTAKKRMKI